MPPPSRDEGWEEGAGATPRDGPPVALLRSPEMGARYRAGGAITFEGRGSDAEDGALPASAFTWRVDFHDGARQYSFVPSISGMARGTFTVPTDTVPDTPGWYRIHLQVRDSDGNTHAVFRDVHPQEAQPGEHRVVPVR